MPKTHKVSMSPLQIFPNNHLYPIDKQQTNSSAINLQKFLEYFQTMLNAPPISPVIVSTVPNAIHDVFLRPCLALFPSNSFSPLSHSFSLHPPLVPFSLPSRSTPPPRAHVLFVAPALERVCAPHPVRKRSPRRRRTVRIPISLPASLSLCGIRVQRSIQCT